MRIITTHHDGHGLNESIKLEADEVGPGGASHYYQAEMPGTASQDFYDNISAFGYQPVVVQFQEGPRNEPGSNDGITQAVLYAILIDRLEGFQAGPYACPENEAQLVHLRECLRLTRARADERAKRGVLGTYAK